MQSRLLLPLFCSILLFSCSKIDVDFFKDHGKKNNEDPANFTEVASIDIGNTGAAEISAYDSKTKRLFVVNNSETNKIDVVGLDNLSNLAVIKSIDVSPFGGLVNSVAVNSGLLAAAIESVNKQQPGKVVVFRTNDYSVVKIITVGSLPDMVCFSPDGKYILTANEGEPSADYKTDPEGTVSIINVKQNFGVTNLDFSVFEHRAEALKSKGLRWFGPNSSFAQDMEPEYVTVSEDSKTAWVTLQENNAIAKIDLGSAKLTDIFPLGFKDYNAGANGIDASDRDSKIAFGSWPVKGMYQPDGMAVLTKSGVPYLFTANEGDVREYDAFNEAARASTFSLDPVAFPGAATLLLPEQIGRLNLTKTLGKNIAGKYDALYSFGARSFSVWNGNTGSIVFDTKNELEQKTVEAGIYDDGRSDDKGVEPEGITVGSIGKSDLAFVGLERADAVAIYDVTNPLSPKFLQLLKAGDAPEGVLFIPASESPSKQSVLVVSSENDGVIKFFTPSKK